MTSRIFSTTAVGDFISPRSFDSVLFTPKDAGDCAAGSAQRLIILGCDCASHADCQVTQLSCLFLGRPGKLPNLGPLLEKFDEDSRNDTAHTEVIVG
jgi:hypothetical protein